MAMIPIPMPKILNTEKPVDVKYRKAPYRCFFPTDGLQLNQTHICFLIQSELNNQLTTNTVPLTCFNWACNHGDNGNEDGCQDVDDWEDVVDFDGPLPLRVVVAKHR